MNKVELVKAVATKTGFSQKDVKEVMNSIFDSIEDMVASGDKVNISGFGAFEVTERAAREGRNPATGEPLHIEASKAPKFKASTSFKETVKNS